MLRVCILVSILTACANQFAYKKNDWKLVTETPKPDYKTVYVDQNRVSCENGKCTAWIKMIFGNEEDVNFSGDKEGAVSGYMKVKRMDASVEYDCDAQLATIISYQFYDKNDTMMDAKWINFEPELAKPGTVHGDILKFVCK